MVLRLRQHNIGYTADGFYRSDDPTNSVKALKEVVSHPDRPQSNHAHLTVLQYYNMNADITQENNLTHTSNLSTVSELSEMKPNLVDRICKLLK